MTSAFAMIARCADRQWAGLTEQMRLLARIQPDPGYVFVNEEFFYPLWTVENEHDAIFLISVKTDVPAKELP